MKHIEIKPTGGSWNRSCDSYGKGFNTPVKPACTPPFDLLCGCATENWDVMQFMRTSRSRHLTGRAKLSAKQFRYAFDESVMIERRKAMTFCRGCRQHLPLR